jgi:hypothetical protein
VTCTRLVSETETCEHGTHPKIVGWVCGEAMQEVRRQPDGDRWCFTCRQRRAFAFVVTAPVGPSYYGPNCAVKCETCGTSDGDLFPGRYREWD